MIFGMGGWTVTFFVICLFGMAQEQGRNWTETSTETIWRTRYANCDKEYSVDLPTGVVGHSSLPPSPNHGFLVSPSDPGTTEKIGIEDPRIISIYDEYDALDLGSAREVLEWELKSTPKQDLLHVRRLQFQGFPALELRYRTKENGHPAIQEELIVYRKRANLIYKLFLRTTEDQYARDAALLARIRAGFRLLPIPKGSCSTP